MNFNDEIITPPRIKEKLTPEELLKFLFENYEEDCSTRKIWKG